MDAKDWDSRYDETDLRWSRGPNRWIAEITADLPPGRVLDLAAGEGRNAIWLPSEAGTPLRWTSPRWRCNAPRASPPSVSGRA